jgi:hypothetical protein
VISNNASTGEPTKDQMKAFEEFNRRNGGNWKADWNSFLGNPIAVFAGRRLLKIFHLKLYKAFHPISPYYYT